MGAAEDDDDTDCGPQAAGTEQDDAVADATVVCLYYIAISQWSGSLLGDFKCYQDCYPILCYRMGRLDSSNG